MCATMNNLNRGQLKCPSSRHVCITKKECYFVLQRCTISLCFLSCFCLHIEHGSSYSNCFAILPYISALLEFHLGNMKVLHIWTGKQVLLSLYWSVGWGLLKWKFLLTFVLFSSWRKSVWSPFNMEQILSLL